MRVKNKPQPHNTQIAASSVDQQLYRKWMRIAPKLPTNLTLILLDNSNNLIKLANSILQMKNMNRLIYPL